MQDLSAIIDFSKWPSDIPSPKGKQKGKGPDVEEDTDDSGSAPIIEDLELDDQHAQFLHAADVQEEDEVEKLLGKVAECCEELAINFNSTQDDIKTLFN